MAEPEAGTRGGALHRAQEYLNDVIRRARSRAQPRLAPLPVLAARAHVSQTTMIKAVGVQRARGVLTVSRGRGIRLALDEPVLEIPLQQAQQNSGGGPRWQRLARQMKRDIAARMVHDGVELPSTKELTSRYGVCRRTLRRAIDSLIADSVLVERRRKLVTRLNPSSDRPGNTVVLILRGDSFGEPSLYCPRTREHLRELEGACARARVRLEVITCYYILTELQGLERVRQLLADSESRSRVLGFMVWTMAIEGDFLAQLFDTLRTSRLPVAVLEETGVFARTGIAQWDQMRLFALGLDARAGRDMARFLHARGHKRVALIGNAPISSYTQVRFEGLSAEYDALGLAGAVQLIIPQEQPMPARMPQLDNVNTLVEILVPRYVERTQGRFSVRERIAVRIADEIAISRDLQHGRDLLFPELDRLAAQQSLCAWVGSSDNEALVCMDYLRINQRSVGRHISVAGFDDSYEAFAQQLTSYNFNGAAYVNAMLEYLLRPDDARGGGEGLATFDGYVAERHSTATPRDG